MAGTNSKFESFVDVIAALRDPQNGCPWDLAQTHESIRPYLVEEAYEVLEAISQGNDKEFCLELGDLLLQVILHAQIAKDRGAFDINDIIEGVKEKIIRRHPHVFGETKASSPLEASKSWEQAKLAEGKEKGLFDGIPHELPALLKALRMSEKASHIGFDWKSFQGVKEKLSEELGEFQEELDALNEPPSPQGNTPLEDKQRAALEHEFGDVLFSLVQMARWLGLSPEDALRSTCERFKKRFLSMQSMAKNPLQDMQIDELQNLWQEAKKQLASQIEK